MFTYAFFSAIKQTDCESEDSNDDSSDIDNIECKETKTIIHDSFSDDNIIEDESLDESSDEEEESDEEKEDHQNAGENTVDPKTW